MKQPAASRYLPIHNRYLEIDGNGWISKIKHKNNKLNTIYIFMAMNNENIIFFMNWPLLYIALRWYILYCVIWWICSFYLCRPSEKTILPAEVPRSAESATKDPAYKRYARKLCGGGSGSGRGGHRPSTAADGRVSKCWAAVWKRRPRPCGKCCGRKRTAAVTASTAEAASGGRRRLQWWRRCSDKLCCCRGKRAALNKKKLATVASSSDHSVGALGIAPPTMTTDTFCGKLKRRLRRCCCCCGWCCGWCTVPKFFKRICCCCGRGKSATPKSKSADSQKRSLFKCTGCCTVSTSSYIIFLFQ